MQYQIKNCEKNLSNNKLYAITDFSRNYNVN